MRRTFVPLSLILATVVVLACAKNREHPASDTPNDSGVVSDGSTPGPTPSSSTQDGGGEGDGSTPPPPPPPSKVDVTNETIDVDGEARTYVLAVPKNYDAAKKYPLVFVVHGDYGNGSSMRALHTFDDASGDEAIVVYPNGATDPAWTLELSDGNRDFKFLQKLITALGAKYTLDDARIFGTGYSSGGFFINFAACQLGLFRALAPYAGGAPYTNDPENPVPTCTSNRLVATIVFHGDKDGAVPLSSGKWAAQYWAGRNGCTVSDAEPSLDVAPPPCKAYAGCPSDRPVELCIIPGLGHIPWSNGAKTTWAFFKSLP